MIQVYFKSLFVQHFSTLLFRYIFALVFSTRLHFNVVRFYNPHTFKYPRHSMVQVWLLSLFVQHVSTFLLKYIFVLVFSIRFVKGLIRLRVFIKKSVCASALLNNSSQFVSFNQSCREICVSFERLEKLANVYVSVSMLLRHYSLFVLFNMNY